MSRFWQNFVSNGQTQTSPVYLGLQGYAVRLDAAQRLHGSAEDGVLVRSVQPGSLADDAGILEGDIVVALGDHPVGSADELFGVLEVLPPGMPVPIFLVRSGRRFERLLVLPEPRGKVRKR